MTIGSRRRSRPMTTRHAGSFGVLTPNNSMRSLRVRTVRMTFACSTRTANTGHASRYELRPRGSAPSCIQCSCTGVGVCMMDRMARFSWPISISFRSRRRSTLDMTSCQSYSAERACHRTGRVSCGCRNKAPSHRGRRACAWPTIRQLMAPDAFHGVRASAGPHPFLGAVVDGLVPRVLIRDASVGRPTHRCGLPRRGHRPRP